MVKVLNKLFLSVNNKENVGIIGLLRFRQKYFVKFNWTLEQPSSGDIIICNVDFNKLKNEEKVIFRKENIGFIFQNNQLRGFQCRRKRCFTAFNEWIFV